jgi:hypothetical protein
MHDPLRDAVGRRVVAHVAGVSVHGTVARVDRRSVTLTDVAVVDNGAATDADGVFVVDRPAMFQVVPVGAPRPASGIAAEAVG